MSLLTPFIIIILVALTIARAIINAQIFNNLHASNNEMMLTARDTSSEEIDKSNESVLFALYCALVMIWFRFKKTDLKWVLLNYFLTIITILITIGYFTDWL